MARRKTQDPAYWGDGFAVTHDDLQYISTLLIDKELPLSAEELAGALILHRVRQEEALIERAISKGTPYRPDGSFPAGEQLVFPVLDYRVGKVLSVRAGQNPEYGPFRVIMVEFANGDRREFACELQADHILNREVEIDLSGEDEGTAASAAELAAQHAPRVTQLLEQRLEEDPHFVRLAGKWFRRDLLVEVHVGHLNLAEAVLDVAAGGPLPTEALLGDLELPQEVTPQLRIFSLNYALQEDERFDEVGPAGQVLWFLHRLEPEGVRSIPPSLLYRPQEYDATLLTSEMLVLERQLDDEWSEADPSADVTEPIAHVLTFPHWRSGTLPLSGRLARLFPTGRTQRIRFIFVDGDTGAEMPGWVVRKARYAYGLKDWYEKHGVPVGAYLELARGEEPGKVVIRRRSRRPRREWVRVARPVEGRLTFELRKTLISSEYDELMILEEELPGVVDAVRTRVSQKRLGLKQVIAEVFPELVKLSPQGTVHAATLYNAVNIALRTPPGPLLAELVASGLYSPMGDHYWVLRSGPGGV